MLEGLIRDATSIACLPMHEVFSSQVESLLQNVSENSQRDRENAIASMENFEEKTRQKS